MTPDDEAFIRRIVDSPGDDLPRLVYADWLDERGDPRGAYLRAEREAVATGDIDRLRELSRALDPVWAARVSLPPIGACIEHTEVSHRGPSISRTEVAQAERHLVADFPPEYTAFLLNYNGGWLCRDTSFVTADGSPLLAPDGTPILFDDIGWRLYPLGQIARYIVRQGDLLDGTAGSALAWRLPQMAESVECWLSRYLVVGHDPDYIGGLFLGVSGEEVGQVRILDTSVEIEVGVRHDANQPPYATTFSAFLESLPGYMPPAAAPGYGDIPH